MGDRTPTPYVVAAAGTGSSSKHNRSILYATALVGDSITERKSLAGEAGSERSISQASPMIFLGSGSYFGLLVSSGVEFRVIPAFSAAFGEAAVALDVASGDIWRPGSCLGGDMDEVLSVVFGLSGFAFTVGCNGGGREPVEFPSVGFKVAGVALVSGWSGGGRRFGTASVGLYSGWSPFEVGFGSGCVVLEFPSVASKVSALSFTAGWSGGASGLGIVSVVLYARPLPLETDFGLACVGLGFSSVVFSDPLISTGLSRTLTAYGSRSGAGSAFALDSMRAVCLSNSRNT